MSRKRFTVSRFSESVFIGEFAENIEKTAFSQKNGQTLDTSLRTVTLFTLRGAERCLSFRINHLYGMGWTAAEGSPKPARSAAEFHGGSLPVQCGPGGWQLDEEHCHVEQSPRAGR